jgi:protein-tyrosine kinase
MSRIHAAVRRAAEPSFDEHDPVDAPAPSHLAREIAGMVMPWDTTTDLPLGDLPFVADHAPVRERPAPARPAPEWVAPPVPAAAGSPFEVSRPANFPAPAELEEKLVVASNAKLFCVEQYRKLAAALHHAQAERGIKVILICSALPGEGKTLTSVNLALTLSESYKRRVLLVDADLRHPAVHKVFQAPSTEGLNETLRSVEDRPVPVLHVSPELSLLPAGAPSRDPMHVLTSDRMKRVIQYGAERFDWVIIDTPPVALLPDAKLLASMADGVLVVIRAGETPYRPIHRALESIGRERILGVVLNHVEDRVISDAKFGSYYDASE